MEGKNDEDDTALMLGDVNLEDELETGPRHTIALHVFLESKDLSTHMPLRACIYAYGLSQMCPLSISEAKRVLTNTVILDSDWKTVNANQIQIEIQQQIEVTETHTTKKNKNKKKKTVNRLVWQKVGSIKRHRVRSFGLLDSWQEHVHMNVAIVSTASVSNEMKKNAFRALLGNAILRLLNGDYNAADYTRECESLLGCYDGAKASHVANALKDTILHVLIDPVSALALLYPLGSHIVRHRTDSQQMVEPLLFWFHSHLAPKLTPQYFVKLHKREAAAQVGGSVYLEACCAAVQVMCQLAKRSQNPELDWIALVGMCQWTSRSFPGFAVRADELVDQKEYKKAVILFQQVVQYVKNHVQEVDFNAAQNFLHIWAKSLFGITTELSQLEVAFANGLACPAAPGLDGGIITHFQTWLRHATWSNHPANEIQSVNRVLIHVQSPDRHEYYFITVKALLQANVIKIGDQQAQEKLFGLLAECYSRDCIELNSQYRDSMNEAVVAWYRGMYQQRSTPMSYRAAASSARESKSMLGGFKDTITGLFSGNDAKSEQANIPTTAEFTRTAKPHMEHAVQTYVHIVNALSIALNANNPIAKNLSTSLLRAFQTFYFFANNDLPTLQRLLLVKLGRTLDEQQQPGYKELGAMFNNKRRVIVGYLMAPTWKFTPTFLRTQLFGSPALDDAKSLQSQIFVQLCAGTSANLESILKYAASFWLPLTAHSRFAQLDIDEKNAQDGGLSAMVAIVHRLRDHIEQEKLTVRELLLCRHYKQHMFTLMARVCDYNDRAKLNLQLEQMDQYDRSRGVLRVFLNHWAHCGVALDSYEFKREFDQNSDQHMQIDVLHMRRELTEGLFQGMLLGNLETYLPWLAAFEDSALLQLLWQRYGTELINMILDPQKNPGNYLNDLTAMQLYKIEEKRQFRVAPPPDFRGIPLETTRDVLIPVVFQAWHHVLAHIAAGTISVSGIHALGTVLSDEKQRKRELDLLGNTYAHEIKSDWNISLADKVERSFKNFSLLNKVRKHLPGLVELRTHIARILVLSADNDELYHKITNFLEKEVGVMPLRDISQIAHQLNESLTIVAQHPTKMDFLNVLSNKPSVIEYLFTQDSTQKFMSLMKVTRSRTDNDRMIAAMGSLTKTRTAVLPVLYGHQYEGLADFLAAFTTHYDDSPQTHNLESARALVQTFDALMKLIKDRVKGSETDQIINQLKLIMGENGQVVRFTLHGNRSKDDCFSLKLESKADVAQRDDNIYTLPRLRNLCSSMMMIDLELLQRGSGDDDDDMGDDLMEAKGEDKMNDEVKESLIQTQNLFKNFMESLTLIDETAQLVSQLHNAGHDGFQGDFHKQFAFFDPQNHNLLANYKVSLSNTLVEWQNYVIEMRTRFYYLNHYTVNEAREVRRLLVMFLRQSNASNGLESKYESKLDDSVYEMIDMSNEISNWICQNCHEQLPDSLDAQRLQSCYNCGTARSESGSTAENWDCVFCTSVNHVLMSSCEVCGTQRANMPQTQGNSTISPEQWVCDACTTRNHDLMPTCATCETPKPTTVLSSSQDTKVDLTGAPDTNDSPSMVRTDLLAFLHLVARSFDEERVLQVLAQGHMQLDALSTENLYLGALGELLDSAFRNEPLLYVNCDLVYDRKNDGHTDVLASDTKNRCLSDAVWMSEVKSSSTTMLLSILSLYVRRGRVPEPSEILLCSANTTLTEIELLMSRFENAAQYGRSGHVFCVANVENLSYGLQVEVMARIEALADSTIVQQQAPPPLVFVSLASDNRKMQELISAFPNRRVDLPALHENELRASLMTIMKNEFRAVAVHADTNGGGKSDWILRDVHKHWSHDRSHSEGRYTRIPYREQTQSHDIVKLLRTDTPTVFFHLDLGHVLPADTNNILFQLVILGIVKSSATHEGRPLVYCRRPQHSVYLEVPHTLDNVTAEVLKVGDLLKEQLCLVNAQAMEITEPVFAGGPGSWGRLNKLRLDPRSEVLIVSKFLHAVQLNVIDDAFDVHAMENLNAQECFNVLTQYSQATNFAMIISFANYLSPSVRDLGSSFLCAVSGLKKLWSDLVVRTAREFCKRSVPPGQQHMDLAARFEEMVRYEQTDHPIAVFYKQSPYAEVDGVDLFSRNPHYNTGASAQLLKDLSDNSIDVAADMSKETRAQFLSRFQRMGLHTVRPWVCECGAHNIARTACRLCTRPQPEDGKALGPLDPNFVLTLDNLIKICTVYYKLSTNIPCIISGETGCGKSKCVEALTMLMKGQGTIECRTLNVHGGLTDADIIKFMTDTIRTAEELKHHEQRITVFFDEMNTCNSLALFKEIVCDRTLNGIPLPNNIQIVAAVNPYRLRRDADTKTSGLQFQYNKGGVVRMRDPLKDLVYRVHPLPESMIDYVYDFGELSRESESHYTALIVQSAIRGDFAKLVHQLVCAAQAFIRLDRGNETSAASLRDVTRCVKLYNWFSFHFVQHHDYKSPDEADCRRDALVCALAYCYYARLPRNSRYEFSHVMGNTFQRYRQLAPWAALTAHNFSQCLNKCQRMMIADHFSIGAHISLNEALLENMFMLFVSILCVDFVRLAIFVIGKPGSSKSLALTILEHNMNGPASESEYLRRLPQLNVFRYQCSPQSESSGIQDIFDQANKFAETNTFSAGTSTVVLLDEVGLAEESPHLPLKVLHKILDDPKNRVTLVGISNWALDPAKMNRAVHLERPTPTADDLAATARDMIDDKTLKVGALANAYYDVYTEQKRKDFWGLRAWYSLLKQLDGHEGKMTRDDLINAVCRNFGGQPMVMYDIVEKFLDKMNMLYDEVAAPPDEQKQDPDDDDDPMMRDDLAEAKGGDQESPPMMLKRKIPFVLPRTLDLIRQNIVSVDTNNQESNWSFNGSRHLMLLTSNIAALNLVFDGGVLTPSECDVLFGSDFPADKSDHALIRNVQRVTRNIRMGVKTILVHCDLIYESLYDLLNQKYIQNGDKLFVNIVVGTRTQVCSVHPQARIVAIVDVDNHLDPPFLNRFEKQQFDYAQVLTSTQDTYVGLMARFIDVLCSSVADVSEVEHRRGSFCGYHGKFLDSLIYSVVTSMHGEREHGLEVMGNLMRTLLSVALPEMICSMSEECAQEMKARFNIDVSQVYFEEQKHGDFVSAFLCLAQQAQVGMQTIMYTFAPVDASLKQVFLSKQDQFPRITVRKLHTFDSEVDVIKCLDQFFANCADVDGKQQSDSNNNDNNKSNVFVMQCDLVGTSLRQIAHTKYMVEKARSAFQDKCPELSAYVHVIFLVHLQREDEQFRLDFDTRWTAMYVDSIAPVDTTIDLPSVAQMLNRSTFDIFENVASFHVVAQKSFRFALARLEYADNKLTHEDVENQIKSLVTIFGEETLCNRLLPLFLHILKSHPGAENMPTRAFKPRTPQLAYSSTLRGAIQQYLVDTAAHVLAVLLARIDRNFNMQILSRVEMKDAMMDEDDMSASDVWLNLADDFMRHTQLELLPESGDFAHVKVRMDTSGAQGQLFRAKFPFSWILLKEVNGFRKIAEDLPSEHETAQVLRAHLSITDTKWRFHIAQLDAYALQQYCHDFTCMTLPYNGDMSRVKQSDMLWSLLGLHENGDVADLSDFHARFWRSEWSIQRIFELAKLAMEPTCRAVNEMCEQKGMALGIATDLHVLVAVTQYFLLQHAIAYAKGVRPLKEWLRQVYKVKSVLMALLAPTDSMQVNNTQAQTLINRLDFLQVLTRKILLPFYQRQLEPIVKNLEQVDMSAVGFLDNMKTFIMNFAPPSFPSSTPMQQQPIEGKSDLTAVEPRWNEMQISFRKAAADVIEAYIFEFCLSGAAASDTKTCKGLSNSLLRELVKLLTISADPMQRELPVLMSPIARMQLLACLRRSYADVTTSAINQLLQRVNAQQWINAPLVSTMVHMQELQLVAQADADFDNSELGQFVKQAEQNHTMQRNVVKHMLANDEGKQTTFNIHDAMKHAALFRGIVSRLRLQFEHMLSLEEDSKRFVVAKDNVIVTAKVLNGMLDQSGNQLVENLRLYVLRLFYTGESRGLGFLRSVLGSSVMQHMNVMMWTGVRRFVGDNKLPRENPFCLYTKYTDAVDSVLACQEAKPVVEEGDIKEEDEQSLIQVLQSATPKHYAALLGAVFQEVFLPCSVLENYDVNTALLVQALQSSEQKTVLGMAATRMMHRLVNITQQQQQLQNHGWRQCLALHPTSTVEQVLRSRLLISLGSNLLSCNGNSVLSWFQTLMLQPNTLAGNQSFFICTPQEADMRVYFANFRRVYMCDNGHPYGINDCGMPVETRKCLECGINIGVGRNGYHTQSDRDYVPQAPAIHPRYCQDGPLAAHSQTRNLSPLGFRVCRFTMHAAMMLSCLAHDEAKNWNDHVRPLLNPEVVKPQRQDVEAFVQTQLDADWKFLRDLCGGNVDDLAMALHALYDEASQTQLFPREGAYRAFSKQERDTLEQRMEALTTAHLKDAALAQSALTMRDRCSADVGDEVSAGRLFIQKLTDHSPCRHVWSIHDPFSYTTFQRRFDVLSIDEKRDYSVLAAFMEAEEIFPVLNELYDVMQWPKLLVQRYNRRISATEAKEITCGSVWQDITSAAERKQWERAFLAFQKAFNLCMRKVLMFGCREIPVNYREMPFTEETCISFCLPRPRDEGICVLGLINYLVRQHNTFLDLINNKTTKLLQCIDVTQDNAAVMSDGKQQAPPNLFEIRRYTLFTSSDALQCNMDEFKSYLAVSFAESSKFDFQAAEAFVVHKYFMFRPFIEAGLDGFEAQRHMSQMDFPHLEDGKTPRKLHGKITQVLLPPTLRTEILTQLSESKQHLYDFIKPLDVAIAMLLAAGSTHDEIDMGHITLATYVQDYLYDTNVSVEFLSIAHDVYLKHLDHLRSVLEEALLGPDGDFFVAIRPKFRTELTIEETKNLEMVIQVPGHRVEMKSLMMAWKDHIREFCVEDTSDAKESLAQYLTYIPETMDEEGEIVEGLRPLITVCESLKMCHALALYKCLEAVLVG